MKNIIKKIKLLYIYLKNRKEIRDLYGYTLKHYGGNEEADWLYMTEWWLRVFYGNNTMKKQNKTATEVMLQEEVIYLAKMNYLLAKALLTGKINSNIVRWAEEIVALYKKTLE